VRSHTRQCRTPPPARKNSQPAYPHPNFVILHILAIHPNFCHPERGIRAPCERRVRRTRDRLCLCGCHCFCRARPLPPKPKDRHFDRSCSRLCEQRSGEIRFSTSTVRQPPHRPPTSAFALLSDPRRRPAVVLVFQPCHLPGRAHLEGCAENPVTSRKSTPLGCAENKPGRGPPLCRRPERSPKGEATDLIAFAFAFIFFLRFQPKNRMSSPRTA
jgi:hypothetical protein